MNTENHSKDSNLEISKKGVGKRENLTPLVKMGIKSLLANKNNVLDPKKYNTLSRESFIQEVKSVLQDIRNDNNDWSEVTTEDIEKIPASDILAELEAFSLPLRQARKLAVSRFFGTFSGLRDHLDPLKLTFSIQFLDENELSDLYTSPIKMKKFVQKEFSLSTDILSIRFYDFRKVFPLADFTGRGKDFYIRTEKAALQYERHGTTPPRGLIYDLLKFYNNPTKQQEICDYFDVRFTISEAVRWGLLDESSLEEIAKKEFTESVWNQLDQKARNYLLGKIRSDDNFELPISEISPEKWSKHILGDTMQSELAAKIYRKIDTLEKHDIQKNNPLSQAELDSNGNIHTSWLEKMNEKLAAKIENFEDWTDGKVLAFDDINGNPQYFKLKASDITVGSLAIPGVTLVSLNGPRPGSIGGEKGKSDISYEDLQEYLLAGVKSGIVMDEAVLRSRATSDKDVDGVVQEGGVVGLHQGQLLWDAETTEKQDNVQALQEFINQYDPEGKEIHDGKVEPGIQFVSKSGEDEREYVYSIKEIQGSDITIMSGAGEETTSIRKFIELIEKQGFKRIAYMKPGAEDTSMLSELGKFGIDTTSTTLEGGDLMIEEEKEVDDGHGHKTKEKKKSKIEYFNVVKGGHIRLGGIKDGIVFFGEYSSNEKLEDIQKYTQKKKLSEKQKNGLYTWKKMSYGSFLKYLKENECKATTDNLLDPHANHVHDPHEHFEGSFFSKVGKWWTIADIVHGVQNLGHHMEHYFEKTSKLNASRFTLAMAKKLGLPADLVAQAQSEEVTNVKEIIEKLREKLGNLNGPHGRIKALHIAHNKDARPEEVAAAMLHMVRGYGHLYAEDIGYAQGSHSFINGFLNACGFKTEADRAAIKQKSRDKFKSDIGTEPGVEITEEEIMWGFMKTMDGKYDEYPLAATVVKAMGGPSGWEKAWRTEGYDGAYQKGLRQGGDTVNPDGRVNKGLSALITHEFNSAVGFMEKAAGKDPSPEYQTIPVVWALAGYSQYISTKTSQEVKKFSDAMGHTLHAYSFLRNYEANKTFRDVFRLALSEIAPGEVAKMDYYIEELQRNAHHSEKDNERCKPALNGLANIWRNYHKQGLHNHLQGKDSWLIEKANKGDKAAKKYIEHLENIHMMNGNEKSPPNDNDWMIQYGYDGSPVFGRKQFGDKTVLSLDRTLNKIHLGSQNYDMNKDDQPRLWPSVLKRVQATKAIEDKELQKAQYYQFREEILTWLRRSIVTRGNPETTLRDIEKKTYYKDLLQMGIDPRVIVMDGETSKVIQKTADEDYGRWLDGGRINGTQAGAVADIIQDTTGKVGQRTLDYKNTASRGDTRYGESRQAREIIDGVVTEDESDG